MSRVGKYPVAIPAGVQVTLDGAHLSVKGKVGQGQLRLPDAVTVTVADGKVAVLPRNNSKTARALWGTNRALIQNMVTGAANGYTRKLDIVGVGYRAAVQGKELVLQLGFSHEIRYPIPAGISIVCEKPTAIAISGFDKQQVGQIASEIRSYRGPEPYKGKGVMYEGEKILRKEGKKK
jgi:large subunit ribosomal protein L6